VAHPVEDEESNRGHQSGKEEKEKSQGCPPSVTFFNESFGIEDGGDVVPDAKQDPVDYQLCSPDASFGPARRGFNQYFGHFYFCHVMYFFW